MNPQDVITGRQVVSLVKDPYIGEGDTFTHSLRLALEDLDTGEISILVIEPDMVALPDECLLFYSLQRLETTLPEPEHLILDLKTRVEADYERGETPSFFS